MVSEQRAFRHRGDGGPITAKLGEPSRWFHVGLGGVGFYCLLGLYPGGEENRRAFHYVVYVGMGGIVYVVALLLLTPVMVSYAAFNTLLFATLFLFGFLSQGIPGITFGMQTALLGTIGAVGLNAQDPVSFQDIVGIYFGIVAGLLLSAVIQRLMWPCFPSGR